MNKIALFFAAVLLASAAARWVDASDFYDSGRGDDAIYLAMHDVPESPFTSGCGHVSAAVYLVMVKVPRRSPNTTNTRFL